VNFCYQPALHSHFGTEPPNNAPTLPAFDLQLSTFNQPLTLFPTTLAGSPQLAENPSTLSPFAATLTSRVKHKSFPCHSYKKHPGGGVYPPQRVSPPNQSSVPLFDLQLSTFNLLPLPISFRFTLFRTLLQRTKSYLPSFQANPNSFRKTPRVACLSSSLPHYFITCLPRAPHSPLSSACGILPPAPPNPGEHPDAL
jgi:hypothetical protein